MSNFIITCHGWSGSNWLAHALNLSPLITCTHSARNCLADDINLQSDTNLKKKLRTLHKGYISRTSTSIEMKYEEIKGYGKSDFYGSVHLIRLRDLPVLDKKFGPPSSEYKVLNLIRHPVDLVWSGYGQFQTLFLYDLNELHWTLGKVLNESNEFLYSISDKYNINLGEIQNLAFISSSCILGSLQLDANAEKETKKLKNLKYLGTLKLEEISKRKSTFIKLIHDLTGEQLTEDSRYINTVFELGKINKHIKEKENHKPSEKYANFSDWQKEVFHFFLTKYKIKDYYSRLGYDMSFISD